MHEKMNQPLISRTSIRDPWSSRPTEPLRPCRPDTGHGATAGAGDGPPNDQARLRMRRARDLRFQPGLRDAADVGACLVLRDVALEAGFEHLAPRHEAV